MRGTMNLKDTITAILTGKVSRLGYKRMSVPGLDAVGKDAIEYGWLDLHEGDHDANVLDGELHLKLWYRGAHRAAYILDSRHVGDNLTFARLLTIVALPDIDYVLIDRTRYYVEAEPRSALPEPLKREAVDAVEQPYSACIMVFTPFDVTNVVVGETGKVLSYFDSLNELQYTWYAFGSEIEMKAGLAVIVSQPTWYITWMEYDVEDCQHGLLPSLRSGIIHGNPVGVAEKMYI